MAARLLQQLNNQTDDSRKQPAAGNAYQDHEQSVHVVHALVYIVHALAQAAHVALQLSNRALQLPYLAFDRYRRNDAPRL